MRWNESQACVILAHVRSGSTFLAHCLSTHPEIHCYRAEPLEPRSVFRKSGLSDEQILSIVLNNWGYKASACKLTLKHLSDEAQEFISTRAIKVIQLRRENVLRTAVSAMLHTHYRRGKIESDQEHTFEILPTAKVSFPPDLVVSQCERIEVLQGRLRVRVKELGAPVLKLTYAQIVGEEGREGSQLPFDVTQEICSFLEVRQRIMWSDLRRRNSQPLSQILKNWKAVKRRVNRTRFAKFLEGEDERRNPDSSLWDETADS